jgi:hypothetical protein
VTSPYLSGPVPVVAQLRQRRRLPGKSQYYVRSTYVPTGDILKNENRGRFHTVCDLIIEIKVRVKEKEEAVMYGLT